MALPYMLVHASVPDVIITRWTNITTPNPYLSISSITVRARTYMVTVVLRVLTDVNIVSH